MRAAGDTVIAPAEQPWGPPWLVWALGEIGQREIVGARHNPRILEYGTAVRLRVTTDEIPWCSNFVNWCFRQSDIEGTLSAAAVSWQGWGEWSPMRLGAVVLFGRSDPDAKGTGHVALCAGWSSTHVLALGGNQANAVSAVLRARSGIVAVRWPSGVP